MAAAILGIYTSAMTGCAADSREAGTGWGSSGLCRMYSVIQRIQVINSDNDEVVLLNQLSTVKRPTMLSFVNQHAMNLAWSKPSFAEMLTASDILLRDGMGAELSLAVLGRAPGKNMVGTDFIPGLAEKFRGRRVAIYGTAEPWISQASDTLRKMGCNVVSALDGFRLDQDYVAAAIADAPELIVLAMGMPKQERVGVAIANAVEGAVVIVNGGAIADYWAGRFARAPLWMRNTRLEWAFRFMLEPRRLWQRYINGGVAFAWRILRLRLALRELQAKTARRSAGTV